MTRRTGLHGVVAHVDVCTDATSLDVAHPSLGKALVQLGPARCRPDQFSRLFDPDPRGAFLARAVFHVGCTGWHAGRAVQLPDTGHGAIFQHDIAPVWLTLPPLPMLNDCYRSMCCLDVPAVRRLDHLAGVRVNLIDRDMQVDVVGVLMQRRYDLVLLKTKLLKEHIEQFLHLFRCRLLALMPARDPVLNRVLRFLALHRQRNHLGLLALERAGVEAARRQVQQLFRLLTFAAKDHAIVVDVIPEPGQASRVIRHRDVIRQVTDVGGFGLARGLVLIDRDFLEDHRSAPWLANWSMYA